jgi:hypothetical protein
MPEGVHHCVCCVCVCVCLGICVGVCWWVRANRDILFVVVDVQDTQTKKESEIKKTQMYTSSKTSGRCANWWFAECVCICVCLCGHRVRAWAFALVCVCERVKKRESHFVVAAIIEDIRREIEGSKERNAPVFKSRKMPKT